MTTPHTTVGGETSTHNTKGLQKKIESRDNQSDIRALEIGAGLKLTHNIREIEEGVDAVFQAVMSDLKEKYRVSDTLSDVLSDSLSKHLTEAITTLYQEVDHQLQKAREEEKERAIQVMRNRQIGWLGQEEDGSDRHPFYDEIQTIIDRYQAELDQDKV